ncbi:hypothetical protein DFH28DRAFT_921606 [Melampsora americana]|nr:hypothetical protein DFH28DRAFT_921606 [Melampsora americana]
MAFSSDRLYSSFSHRVQLAARPASNLVQQHAQQWSNQLRAIEGSLRLWPGSGCDHKGSAHCEQQRFGGEATSALAGPAFAGPLAGLLITAFSASTTASASPEGPAGVITSLALPASVIGSGGAHEASRTKPLVGSHHVSIPSVVSPISRDPARVVTPPASYAALGATIFPPAGPGASILSHISQRPVAIAVYPSYVKDIHLPQKIWSRTPVNVQNYYRRVDVVLSAEIKPGLYTPHKESTPASAEAGTPIILPISQRPAPPTPVVGQPIVPFKSSLPLTISEPLGLPVLLPLGDCCGIPTLFGSHLPLPLGTLPLDVNNGPIVSPELFLAYQKLLVYRAWRYWIAWPISLEWSWRWTWSCWPWGQFSGPALGFGVGQHIAFSEPGLGLRSSVGTGLGFGAGVAQHIVEGFYPGAECPGAGLGGGVGLGSCFNTSAGFAEGTNIGAGVGAGAGAGFRAGADVCTGVFA